MAWLLASLFLFVAYIIYTFLDFFSAGAISSPLMPYFYWISPHSTTGSLLLSMLLLIPAYAVLYLVSWIVLLHWRTIGEFPSWTSWLHVAKDEHGKKPTWPVIPLFISFLILGVSFFVIFADQLRPAHWIIGLIVLWGLFANWLFPEGRKKSLKETAVKESKIQQVNDLLRISAKDLIKKLKALPSYRGQLFYYESHDGAIDALTEQEIKICKTWTHLRGLLEQLGIRDFCIHQQKFVDALTERKNAVLTTPVGSGKHTILDLFSLYTVLEIGESVLIVCPNEKFGRKAELEISSFLQKSRCDWRVKVISFISERDDSDPWDTPPDILIVTPHTLHRFVLPRHKDYESFFASLGYVFLEDVDLYTGVYGTNVAFVMRRLFRICRSKNISATIGAVGCYISNGSGFLGQLTGETFKDINHFSTDSRGYPKHEIIFWNPPLERKSGKLTSQETSLVHKRRNYYEEACQLATEAFLENFDVALLDLQVLFTEHDIRETNGIILERVRKRAEEAYINAIKEGICPLLDQHPEIVSIGDELMRAINERMVPSDVSGNDTNDKQEERPEEDLRRAIELQQQEVSRFAGRYEQLLRDIGTEVTTAEQAQTLMNSLPRTRVLLEEIEAIILNLAKATPNGTQVAKKAEELIRKTSTVIEKALELLVSEQEKYKRALSRAGQTERRWIANSIRCVVNSGIKTAQVEASFFLGFPLSPRALYEEIIHTGGAESKPTDSLTCVVATPQPLSQYYAKTWKELTTHKAQIHFVVGRNNRIAALNHLHCALYELEGWISEIRRVFPYLPWNFLEDERLDAETKTLVEKIGTDVLEKEELWLSYSWDQQPHEVTDIKAIESEPYSILLSSGESEVERIGAIDSGTRLESMHQGAITDIDGQRYRVTRIDETEKAVYVVMELHQWQSAYWSEAHVSQTSYSVRLSDGTELGKVTNEKLRELGITKNSTLKIEGQEYRIKDINLDEHIVHIEITSTKEFLPELNLSHALIVRRDTSFSFTLEAGPVVVKKQVKGYTTYNALDIEDEEAQIPEKFDHPRERTFTTFGLFTIFNNNSVDIATLHSLAHLIKSFVPSVVSCSEHDIEIAFFKRHKEYGSPVLIIYDNWTGALGITESIWHHLEPLFFGGILEKCYRVLIECPCREGCPYCLHIFQCRSENPNTCFDKKAALELLGRMLGKKDYAEIIKRRYDKIDKDEDGYELREKVFTLLAHNLGIEWKKPVSLVINTELEQRLEKENGLSPRAGVWTDDTLVVREYPEDQMVHVIAHEYTHDWQSRESNMDPRLYDPKYIRTDLLKNFKRSEHLFVEGFAEWVAYRALDFYGLKYIMEPYGKFKTLPMVYRAGFEVVKYIEDTAGTTAVLDFIKTGEGWEFENLYRKSGVRDYVLSQLARAEKMETEKWEDEGQENTE